jgi:hypothetical protein
MELLAIGYSFLLARRLQFLDNSNTVRVNPSFP